MASGPSCSDSFTPSESREQPRHGAAFWPFAPAAVTAGSHLVGYPSHFGGRANSRRRSKLLLKGFYVPFRTWK